MQSRIVEEVVPVDLARPARGLLDDARRDALEAQRVVDHGGDPDLLPGFLIIGLGLPFSYVAVTIAAVAGTKPHEAGLASGLINTSQQIGGAVGIAILSTNQGLLTDREARERKVGGEVLCHVW